MKTALFATLALIGGALLLGRANGQQPLHPCIAAPCSLSLNVSDDLLGEQDSGAWGRHGAAEHQIVFKAPPGYRVHILRLYGDQVAWFRFAPATLRAGALVAFGPNTFDAASPEANGGTGFLYLQQGVGLEPARLSFNYAPPGALLTPDNIMIVKQAVYLNEVGQALHMETTAMVEFRYEAQQ